MFHVQTAHIWILGDKDLGLQLINPWPSAGTVVVYIGGCIKLP